MRRTFAAVLVALSLAATTAAAPSYASPSDDGNGLSLTPPPEPAEAVAEVPTPAQALVQAEAALEGEVAGDRRPEATLAMRDLFVSLPSLAGEERVRAEGLLARPTDGAGDPQGDGYSVPSKKKCTKNLCLHWVPTTADAPPSKKWIRISLRTMKKVWNVEVNKMGYRRPVKDRGRGGKGGKLDVYLSDLGSQGLYGYCAPEFTGPRRARDASGYCVLDNDFSRAEFGAKPVHSLRVTAAHEFFHAVQFAYDYRDDVWFMESSATWMEERVADEVDDNRQYLPQSQLVNPRQPLDTFDPQGTVQYGNWIFFEYLGQRFGQGIVKRIWQDAGGQGGKTYSIDAVKRALPRGVSLKQVYAQFAAANVTPGKSYPEGNAWPQPGLAGQGRLGKKRDVARGTVEISHLASNAFRVAPAKSLDRRTYRLKVAINGPKARTSPMAAIVWQRKNGTVKRMMVGLDRAGRGTRVVPFNRKQTASVHIVAINASTRYACGRGDFTYACKGRPLDDSLVFDLTFRVVKARG